MVLCIAPQTPANSLNSNSIVKDDIEYYLQTDKAVYNTGETVQMLYRVTNLGPDAVVIWFNCGPANDRCDFIVEKDGQSIWNNLSREATFAVTFLTIDPSESISFTISWDMTDLDGNPTATGEYEVTAALSQLNPFYQDKYVPVSATITIIPTTILVPDDYPTIQPAIDAAFPGDTVIVADGTYTGEGNRDIDFLGKAITVKSQNGPENCIIDCQTLGSAFYFHNQEEANSVLAGFTITRGYIGLFFSGSNPSIVNCTIIDNGTLMPKPVTSGIICRNSSPKISNCDISRNFAVKSGGGVYCDSNSSLTITNSTIAANTATYHGGGIYCKDSNLTLINCALTGNSATFDGGAIENVRSSTTVKNCTFTGNSAGNGGAIHYHDSTIALVLNCILWGDVPNEIHCISWPQWEPCPQSEYVKFSNVQGCCLGQNNIDADPCFVTPGFWVDINDPNVIVEPDDPNAVWLDGDYHLLAGSPCIDTGDPNYVPEPNETDLDGNPRVVNGRIDMGAYEFELLPVIEAVVRISPRTLNLQSKGRWLTCHILLPDGCNAADIDPNSIFLEDEIPPDKVVSYGRLAVAKFSRPAVQQLLSDLQTPAEVELLVSGQLIDGTPFEGADTITLINTPGRRKQKSTSTQEPPTPPKPKKHRKLK